MVYTPKKAASAVIAGEAMRTLASGETYGEYPANRRFGDFRVSAEEDLAELVSRSRFMYSNTTKTQPPSPGELRQIVGHGASPLVGYEGTGIYYLDRLAKGMWRLEVYPDVVQVADPFHSPNRERPAFRLVRRSLPITLLLPDLGSTFSIQGLDQGNTLQVQAKDASFKVHPGVFLLRGPHAAHLKPPTRIGNIGLREFVCPPQSDQSAVPYTTPPPPIDLFDPVQDVPMLSVSRSGESRNGPGRLVPGSNAQTRAFNLSAGRKTLEDFSVSLYIGDRPKTGDRIQMRMRGNASGAKVRIVLVDRDGAAWGTLVSPTTDWEDITIPLSDFQPTRWAMLPQGYPGTWNYWRQASSGIHKLDLSNIERLQLSLRSEDGAPASGIQIESVKLTD